MTYGRWKSVMTVGSIGAAVMLILTCILARITGISTASITLFGIFLSLLLYLMVVSFLRPQVMWAVTTFGKTVQGADHRKSYGPFSSKDAAETYRDKWNSRFEGFAVMDYRETERVYFRKTRQKKKR